MFRCQLCQTVVPAGTRTTKIVVATRKKFYSSRGSAPQMGGPRFRGRRTEPAKPYDKGGVGTEIVREASVCPDCALKHDLQAKIEEQKQEAAATAALLKSVDSEDY